MTGVNGRVLVVDDDPMVRELVPIHLAGAEVVTADSGAAARRLVAEDPAGVAAVVVDHRLPDDDGVDLVAALRDLGVAADVPTVLMSGSPDARLRGRAEAAGLVLVDKRDLARLPELLATSGEDLAQR